MLLIGNTYWAALRESASSFTARMSIEVPAMSSTDIDLLIGIAQQLEVQVQGGTEREKNKKGRERERERYIYIYIERESDRERGTASPNACSTFPWVLCVVSLWRWRSEQCSHSSHRERPLIMSEDGMLCLVSVWLLGR